MACPTYLVAGHDAVAVEQVMARECTLRTPSEEKNNGRESERVSESALREDTREDPRQETADV